MIASVASRRFGSRCAILVAVVLLAGCRTPTAPPMVSPMEWLPTLGAYVPDEVDHRAQELAAAGLVSRRGLARVSLARITELDGLRTDQGEPPTGLVPFGRNLLDSTLDDPIAYRQATRALLKRDDLDAGLRARLEADARDDPLELADARLRDARVLSYGRVFNMIVEPLGRSILTGALIPLRLFRALLGVALLQRSRDALSLPERQALAHWKRFIETHPDAPESLELLELVEESQLRWYRTQRDRAVRGAAQALKDGRLDVAHALAERALRFAPEDQRASDLRREAGLGLERLRADQRRSLGAPVAPTELTKGRGLTVALLTEPGAVESRASEILEEEPEGPLADEARFALALIAGEGGEEDTHWKTLRSLAREGPASNMARHAQSALNDPEQNPLRAFHAARRAERWQRVGWLFLGSLREGPRDRDLPRFLEWVIDLPSFLEALTGIPNRLVRFPWQAPHSKAPTVWATRYVRHNPEGKETAKLTRWLEERWAARGNHAAALQWAEAREDVDPDHLSELREAAAEQALEVASKERRRDIRMLLLRRTARDYQGTEAGQTAGEQAREEAKRAGSQQIRITRAFLLENRDIAGPAGLAIRPEYLDDELRNGELHRSGITLEGGRVVAFAFVHVSGRQSDEPTIVRRRVSKVRLARLVALLDETALRRALVEPDERLEPDADRDSFFERARLGVANEADTRPSAESSYAFESMREKYGLVRSRESILPVELVLQGSLGGDIGLGAFPRIRMPRPTPDAPLYK